MKKELEDEGDVEKGMFEKFMSFSHRRFAIMFLYVAMWSKIQSDSFLVRVLGLFTLSSVAILDRELVSDRNRGSG